MQVDALPALEPDVVTNTGSLPHCMRQVLLERLAVDGRAGCVSSFGPPPPAALRLCWLWISFACRCFLRFAWGGPSCWSLAHPLTLCSTDRPLYFLRSCHRVVVCDVVLCRRLPTDVMRLQDEVHPIHRSMLVDWLVEVVEVRRWP